MVTGVLDRDSVGPTTSTVHGRSRAKTAVDREKIRLSLDVSHELNELLDTLAYKTHSSKSEVLRKAIALMELAVIAKEQGQTIGVAEKGGVPSN